MASQTRSVDNTVSSQWADPDNAFTENDLCTSTSSTGNQNVYNIIGTPFTLPTGAIIDGIEVKIIRGGDVDDYYSIELQDKIPAWKLKNGTAYLAVCADGVQEALGGALDEWGGSWDAAHINSSSFQIRLTFIKSGKANSMQVDHIEIVVYYHEVWYCTLNGTIEATEVNCVERGFDWDIDSGAPYANEWTEEDSFGVGSFSHQITGLDLAETYYFRAKARNAAGWGYGSEKSVSYEPPEGWTGKIIGVTDPAKIMGIPAADIAKVMGAA